MHMITSLQKNLDETDFVSLCFNDWQCKCPSGPVSRMEGTKLPTTYLQLSQCLTFII